MNVDFKAVITALYDYFIKVLLYFYPELDATIKDKIGM